MLIQNFNISYVANDENEDFQNYLKKSIEEILLFDPTEFSYPFKWSSFISDMKMFMESADDKILVRLDFEIGEDALPIKYFFTKKEYSYLA